MEKTPSRILLDILMLTKLWDFPGLCFLLQPIILHLLDIDAMMSVLTGVVMEMQDCALPLLVGKLVYRF